MGSNPVGDARRSVVVILSSLSPQTYGVYGAFLMVGESVAVCRTDLSVYPVF